MNENEEYPTDEDQDPMARRVNEVLERLRRIREPFRQRRRSIVDSLLGSLEKRSRERYRSYRYHNPLPSEEEESEVERLKAEVEELKQQLAQLTKPEKTTRAYIRPE